MLADTKMHTETEKLFALDKPSLENLSYCLRHPETWPEGFIWDYRKCDQCAMGLAHNLWSVVPRTSNLRQVGSSIMARSFAMPYESAACIFYGTLDWMPTETNRTGPWFWPGSYVTSTISGDVTPEMVADQIDKHLASSK